MPDSESCCGRANAHNAAPTAPAYQTFRLSRSRFVLILSILLLANLVGAFDGTIVATLTRVIMDDLGASSVIAWLGASYLIATALVQPLCGQFSDIYTRRTCLLIGCITLLLGNIICGTAKSFKALVAGRFLSGIGGGACTIMPTIILTDITPKERRGLWQGINNITFASGYSLGGIFGGLTAYYWSWRGSFLTLIAPAFLLMIGVVLIPEPNDHDQGGRRSTDNENLLRAGSEDCPLLPRTGLGQGSLDIVGATLLCIGLGLLLASAQQLDFGNSNLNFMVNVFGFTISCISLSGFIYHSIFVADRPLLPLKLLTNPPSIGYICLMNFLSLFSYFIGEFYLPILMSLQEDVSLEVVGWCLSPLTIGAAVGSLLTGALLSRHKSSHLLLGSSVVMCMGPFGISLSTHSGFVRIHQLMFTFIWGFGFGGVTTISLVKLLGAIPTDIQAPTTSLMYTSRCLGGAFSLPAAGFVLNMIREHRLRSLLIRLTAAEDPGVLPTPIQELIQSLLANQPTNPQMPDSWIARIQNCEIRSVAFIFLLSVVSSLFTLLLSLLIIYTEE
ncbi:related to VBA1-Vacuolar Basic Amino acid transporter [Fusarium fujikuroi]|nr:related to VBA1-Vacuolar Basic Amino acid transporter [Fusarium fujikuroi]